MRPVGDDAMAGRNPFRVGPNELVSGVPQPWALGRNHFVVVNVQTPAPATLAAQLVRMSAIKYGR
jgi:hypothetical protein